MIVYLATKDKFRDDIFSNRIDEIILTAFKQNLGRSAGKSEVDSWRNSLPCMDRILEDSQIPNDAGVAVEFNIPNTSKRIDFILTGRTSDQKPCAVIIELKQWSKVASTPKDAIVRTFIGGGEREVSHPSYQAWAYAQFVEDYNETVRNDGVQLSPCAYLHNCESYSVINAPFYEEHTKRAPTFLKDDAQRLRDFIKKHVKYGDRCDTMYRIRDGKLRPSKSLADHLVSLLQGNREFLMIDDQKLVYETALHLAKTSTPSNKNVLIVHGGPGTGKTVVAVNLLVQLTKDGQLTQYVTKNAAPRAVYESKLTGTFKKTRISNLFVGSGGFTDTKQNLFQSLIVDEAHRLNEKSGLFQNLGDNQIKELINSAAFTVFFLDESQRIHWKDIGERDEIVEWADGAGATVTEQSLESQFRCNGSDGYLAWVDNTLQIRETVNTTLESINYDFRVCESASELRDLIYEKNERNNKARMVAGYCWDWITKKKQPDGFDIVFPDQGFAAKWNLTKDGSLWLVSSESVSEVGCIHTCQGLELEYVGVILGPDLVARNGKIETNAKERSSMDSSVKGYKQLHRRNPEVADKKADEIIKNTYRTLMTRGLMGCFVYSVDAETNEFLQSNV